MCNYLRFCACGQRTPTRINTTQQGNGKKRVTAAAGIRLGLISKPTYPTFVTHEFRCYSRWPVHKYWPDVEPLGVIFSMASPHIQSGRCCHMPHIYILPTAETMICLTSRTLLNLQALHTSPCFVDFYPESSVVMHASP